VFSHAVLPDQFATANGSQRAEHSPLVFWTKG